MLQSATVKFLQELKLNNNKPWFDAHRSHYENAKNDFIHFIDGIINELGKTDVSIAHLKAKDCLFRINRDVRFSKDKSPYKTNFGAYINGEGKKSVKGGYYFHLEPGNSFTGGGIWQPMPNELNKLRQEIDYNFDEFKKIVGTKKFKDTYGRLSTEGALIRLPKGYEADNPAADYLKLKSFVALKPLTDKDLTDKALSKTTMNAYKVLMPLIIFLNKGIE